MNNIYKILSVVVFCVILASCSKSSTDADTPIRDYAEQYATDLASIESYIDTHYLTYDADYNVTFDTLLPTSGHSSIRTDSSFHLGDTTIVEDGINYKVYFIKFREGTQRRPTQVDSVYISYKGTKLKKKSTTGGEDVFDTAQTPVWFKLQEVITGWAHMIPNFKTGTYTGGSGGNPIAYNNYGAGVMFLPSGLAYFNNGAGTISSYTPIVFSFKLLELQYRDHDGDGILSKDERKMPPITPVNKLTRWRENPYGNDYNGDGALDTSSTLYDSDGDGVLDSTELYDTDRDGIPNMYDIDDDGDNYTTRSETKKIKADITATSAHYPFEGAINDDPSTPYDERKGVPRKFTGPSNTNNPISTPIISDFTDPTRLRKYLDPTCHFEEEN
jgi:FKBP-type peptidyl-prolyl cis-trans isomerase FkpA